MPGHRKTAVHGVFGAPWIVTVAIPPRVAGWAIASKYHCPGGDDAGAGALDAAHDTNSSAAIASLKPPSA